MLTDGRGEHIRYSGDLLAQYSTLVIVIGHHTGSQHEEFQ